MLSEFWALKGWFALIPLAIAALAFYAWIGIGADARAMARQGIEVQGTIMELRRVIRPAPTPTGTVTVLRVSSNYSATVMFPTGRATDGTLEIRQVTHFISADYYGAHSEGDRVPVRYLPDDPERIELEPQGTASNAAAAGWVALGMAACAVVIGGLIWTQAGRVHLLRTEGVEVPARIDRIARASGVTVLHLTLPDGRAVRAQPPRRKAEGLVEGDTLPVLADPRVPALVLLAGR